MRAATNIALAKRAAARQPPPPVPPPAVEPPRTFFPDAYPPGLAEKEVSTLQLRQLEDDAIYLLEKRPELAPDLHRFVGKDAVAAAMVMQEAMQRLNDKRPKVKLDPGSALPQDDQVQLYQEEMVRYKVTIKDMVNETLPKAREAAEAVRRENEMAAELVLQPPIETTVPANYFVEELERLVERLERQFTISLGFVWHHTFSKIPPAVDALANLQLRALFDPGVSAHDLRQEYVERLKAIDPSLKPQSRLTVADVVSIWRAWRAARATYAELAKVFAADEAKALAEAEEKARLNMEKEKKAAEEAKQAAAKQQRKPDPPGGAPPPEEPERQMFDPNRKETYLMRFPRSLDPRDWAVFVFNRVYFYSAYVVAWLQTFKETDPYMSEQTKRFHSVMDPALDHFRDSFLETLRQMEKQTPPPWDPQELPRVRLHGMQERMTMKEAALILGMSYVAFLLRLLGLTRYQKRARPEGRVRRDGDQGGAPRCHAPEPPRYAG